MSSSASSDEDHEETEPEPEVTFLHFIKANFTLNISSGSLSHFLSQGEK